MMTREELEQLAELLNKFKNWDRVSHPMDLAMASDMMSILCSYGVYDKVKELRSNG